MNSYVKFSIRRISGRNISSANSGPIHIAEMKVVFSIKMFEINFALALDAIFVASIGESSA